MSLMELSDDWPLRVEVTVNFKVFFNLHENQIDRRGSNMSFEKCSLFKIRVVLKTMDLRLWVFKRCDRI